MAKADLLSRRADHDHGKTDNTNVTLLKAEHFRANRFSLEGFDQNIIDQIKACHDSQDPAVIKAITNKEKGWTDDGEIAAWEHRLYVPRNARLRKKIICFTVLSRRPSRQRSLSSMVWWMHTCCQIT